MNVFSIKHLGLSLVCLGIASLMAAQSARTPEDRAVQYLREHHNIFHLSAQDVAELQVTDAYRSKHNGVTHVWIQQLHRGIPVHNAMIGLHVLPNGEIAHLGHRFVQELSSNVNTTLPSLSAAKALEMAKLHLGFQGFPTPGVRERVNDQNWIFHGGAISREPIPVQAVYQPTFDGRVRLAWHMVIDQANTSDMWSIRVDAVTGEIIDKNNRTVYCKAGHAHAVNQPCTEEHAVEAPQAAENKAVAAGTNGTYRVFALPVESPAHGNQSLVIDPHDPIASPFGWHDTDGQPGPEFTITRGNNVFAYEDRNNSNSPPATPYPDGGPGLVFDFAFDPNAEPEGNIDAAITNLFYMNNMIHDITYRFGFDEAAGNFQANNYGKGGQQGDFVRAEGLDGGGSNNANFATPPDGGSGRMQMYVWDRQGGNILKVNAPVNIIGSYPASPSSGWGAPITANPVTGEVVIVDDGTGEASLGCNPLINNLTGKIAMVDRGICQFGTKAFTAQQAGAKACIICNFEDGTIGMAPGTQGGQVNIPVVMVGKADCDLLRTYVGLGLEVSLALPDNSGPEKVDGDFDNGIIAHEYGHGISNRLTGGPSRADCLGSAEQMGEGWSDWFTLVTAAKPGDVAEKRRGVGTFVLRENNSGQGIRRFPYSADMSVNPHTFATVAQSSGVHAIGEIWATVTWDLYWALVEKYGFDPDLTNPNSGNARAIQLVMDGMKLQPCNPGFIDGRNAIMLAEKITYGGVDSCLLSTVFARRGMGVGASQGSADVTTDGIEDFDPIPSCLRELRITKSGTPNVIPGGEATYTIRASNFKGGVAENVVVTDEMPPGSTLVQASNGGVQNGNLIVWNLGDMPNLTTIELSYTVKTDPTQGSFIAFRDDLDTEDDWGSAGTIIFELQSDVVKVGSAAWRGRNLPSVTDYFLASFYPIRVNGAKPVMRFWHQFNTEAGHDAGFVEVQIDGEATWRRFGPDKLFRAPYTGGVDYATIAIPFLQGFSGNSNGWQQSYIDLSEFAGRDIYIRFRFVSDAQNAPANGGWIVDGLEIIDMYNVNTEACMTTADGDQACAAMDQRGTIMEPAIVSDSEPVTFSGAAMRVQPNPATGFFGVNCLQDFRGDSQLQLFSADGRLVWQRNLGPLSAGQIIGVDVTGAAAGLYLLRLENAQGVFTEKVVLK